MAEIASLTPSDSITSSDSRSPAVSESLTGTPPIIIPSSMMSRVVPGMSVTIARLRPTMAFSNDDFPALGRPAITALTP